MISTKYLYFLVLGVLIISTVNSSYCPVSNLKDNNDINGIYEYYYSNIYFTNLTFDESNSYNCSYVNKYPYYTSSALKCSKDFICPINPINVLTALNKQKWIGTTSVFEKIASISHDIKNNISTFDELKSHPITINIFVIGGSMTAGSDIECGCICTHDVDHRCRLHRENRCKALEDPCKWQSLFFNWLVKYYHFIHPNIEFHHINLAQSGVDSEFHASAISTKIHDMNIILSEYDLFFLDSSCNDAGDEKITTVSMGMEALIIRIQYIMAKALNIPHIRPTIIIIEQFPFAVGYPWHGHDEFPSEIYRNHDYAVVYENLAKHYNLLLWSIRDVYWSYYDNNIDKAYRYPIDVLGKNNPMHHFYHIPWFANLYIADLLAGCFLHVMKSIESSRNIITHSIRNENINNSANISSRDYQSINIPYPKPLYISNKNINSYCDDLKSYLLHYASSSNFHPQNLTAYENILGNGDGWREYIDYHNVSGYMINKYSNSSLRSLTFKFNFQPPSEYLSNQQLLHNWFSKYILKIVYLKSYENMGIIKVILCGIDILTLDGLHIDHNHYKVSIPQYIFYNQIQDVCTINTLDKFHITFEYMNNPASYNEPIRKLAKFKLMEADICESAKGV